MGVSDFHYTDIFDNCPVIKKLNFLFICWLKFYEFFSIHINIDDFKIGKISLFLLSIIFSLIYPIYRTPLVLQQEFLVHSTKIQEPLVLLRRYVQDIIGPALHTLPGH